MLQVFKSEYGEVKSAKFLHETAKGFKVEEDWSHGRKYETTWFIKCPNGNHRAFWSQLDAKNDAVRWIKAEKEKALNKIKELDAKMANLPIT